MRPAMYGAYHHITVMGKEDTPCDHKYDVTGSLCENNDKFAIDRMLPKIDMEDILVIHEYGSTWLLYGLQLQWKIKIRRGSSERGWIYTADQKSGDAGRLFCYI